MDNLKIGLDYDDTFTASRIVFGSFIRMCKLAGHEVAFVTWRKPDGPNKDIEEDARRNDIAIVYCSGKAKQKCFAADIWIDDSPYALNCDAHWAHKVPSVELEGE